MLWNWVWSSASCSWALRWLLSCSSRACISCSLSRAAASSLSILACRSSSSSCRALQPHSRQKAFWLASKTCRLKSLRLLCMQTHSCQKAFSPVSRTCRLKSLRLPCMLQTSTGRQPTCSVKLRRPKLSKTADLRCQGTSVASSVSIGCVLPDEQLNQYCSSSTLAS